jgi:hypothetical protein
MVRVVVATLPMISPDDDPPPDSEKPEEPALKVMYLRLDAEHFDALSRVAGFEKLSSPNTLRKLIRIADQMVSGSESPFASRLEHLLLPRKKVG